MTTSTTSSAQVASSVSSLLASFMEASAVPVVKPVLWPADVNIQHPLRKLDLYVKYWSVDIKAMIDGIIAEETEINPPPPPPKEGQAPQPYTNTWIPRIYWFVIACSVCDDEGNPIFASNWEAVYRKAITEAATDLTVPPAQYDNLSQLVIPPPDFNIIGVRLKATFETEQGRAIMWPLFMQAMAYNGFSGDDSKN